MKRFATVALAALAFLSASGSAAATVEDVAREVLIAYQTSRAAGMLHVERACWKRATRDNIGTCTQKMIAGGVIDAAMQQAERRGPTVAFSPAVQRERYMRETKRIGMDAQEAQETLEAIVHIDLPLIVKGLTEAGLRLY